ncbi:MAG: DNA polymerase IV, partial [Acidimicrobiia bacterium]
AAESAPIGAPSFILETMRGEATILHADLDAFYASVAVRDDPSLRGLPVAVGGGVILAATYEARRHGVRSGMSGTEARRRCPDLRMVPAQFEEYVAASKRVMEVFERYTPLVESISIDEAFLDVAGSVRLFGAPVEMARAIRSAVRTEVGLPISVGVATTKHLAKIASRVAKPDGLVVVPPGRETEFLHPLPIDYLWGVGPVGEKRLARYGIGTIGDLATFPAATLAGWLGDHWGAHLWHLANNIDARPVIRSSSSGSVGAQSAGDATELETRHRTLLALADRIGIRLRRKERAGRRVTVRVRFGDMQVLTRAATLPGPIAETSAIYRQAATSTDAVIAERGGGRRVTLVGISVSLLERTPHVQLELPLPGLGPEEVVRAGSAANVRQRELEVAVDRARERFGRNAVRRLAVLDKEPEVRSPADRMES